MRLPEQDLGGAAREGDAVVRAAGPWTPAVHALLEHLVGLAARPLGARPRRERLEFVPGDVLTMPPWSTTRRSRRSAGLSAPAMTRCGLVAAGGRVVAAAAGRTGRLRGDLP